MHPIRLLAATGLFAAGIAGTLPAAAQTAPAGPGEPASQRPDPFGDATIPRTAAQADAARRFDALDTNHDSALGKDELAAGRPSRPAGSEHPQAESPGGDRRGRFAGRMFDRLDANHDGKLSKDEYVAGQLARFDRMDGNHDGQLSKAERQAAVEAMRQRMMQRMAQASMGGGDSSPPPGD